MDMNGRWGWHAGGTRAPLLMERGGPPAGIRGRRGTGVVPLRATGSVFRDAEDLMRGPFHVSSTPSGTEWHDLPRKSTRGHRRAR